MVFEEELVLTLEELFPDVTFVFAYRNHTEVSDPYCLIQQVSITPTAQPTINTSHKAEEASEEIVRTPVSCIFFLSFYSQSDSDLQDVSRKFLTSLHSNHFNFAFRKNNLSINTLSNLQFSEESINGTTMLKKAIATLTVSGIVVDRWKMDDIATVEFNGSEKGSGETFFNKTYQVEEREWQK